MYATSGRKCKFTGGVVASTQELLPAVSGMSYLIHSISIDAENTAAETCYGVKVQTTGDDGLPIIVVGCIVPGVANVIHTTWENLDVMTKAGAVAQFDSLGSVAYPYRMYCTIIYEEVSI